MSTNEVNDNTPVNPPEESGVHMESINRIAHLPAVEQTVQVATSIYGAVKDCSSVTNWTLTTAETTAHKAVEMGKPIISQFESSIKKVDEIICSGLDYVEEKIPAVKLPPGEILFQMYNTTKDYVSNKIQPAVETAKNIVEPAVEAAKHIVEPAVHTVREIAEPYVQPTVDTACAIKDYGCNKVREILHMNDGSKPTEAKAADEGEESTENAKSHAD